MGSILAARNAGSSEAALAITASSAMEPAKIHGSRTDVP